MTGYRGGERVSYEVQWGFTSVLHRSIFIRKQPTRNGKSYHAKIEGLYNLGLKTWRGGIGLWTRLEPSAGPANEERRDFDKLLSLGVCYTGTAGVLGA